MDDPLLDVADALVEQLKATFITLDVDGVEYPITVEWTESPDLDLADAKIKNPLVWVLDYSESLVAEKDVSSEQYELIVSVQMKIPDGVNAAVFRRAMSKLVSKISRYLRPFDDTCYLIVDDQSIPCIKTERKPAVDPDEWKEKRRYFTMITTTWRVY